MWGSDLIDLPEPVVMPEADECVPHSQHHSNSFMAQDSRLDGKMGRISDKRDLGPPIPTGLAATCRRKRFIVPLAVFVTLLAIGGVLGGVLGTMVSTGESDSTDQASAVSSRNNTSSILPSSRVALSMVGSSISSIRTILLQNTDGDLVSLEWQGASSTARLVTGSSARAEPVKPLNGSPLAAVTHGAQGDLHLFYIDDTLRFAHAIRRANASDDERWGVGPLSTLAGQKKVQSRPSDKMRRLSVAIVTMNSTTSEPEDYIVVMFQVNPGTDIFCLLSSSDPDNTDSWVVTSFSLGTERKGVTMHPDSPGFVLVPITRTFGSQSETFPGLRMFWDLSDDQYKTTLGAFECTFTDTQTLDQCQLVATEWGDVEGEQIVLDTPKPLFLSVVPLGTSSSSIEFGDYIFRVLDSGGRLVELHGNSSEWTGHNAFAVVDDGLPEGIEENFTAVASADDGLLYAVSEGKLLEFARRGEWWESDGDDDDQTGWRFLSIVDTDLSDS
ncbi:hypothetical protein GMORB2_1479 [Geosmithia morbida]|uniref:Uncharacterized protein n=1 Tax=Geosmithia morbida TaxID=1094350 RepID=A0A9P4Z035_9HYPO|nr:uncharacterized protein GMORB2_1479 [Geosmithia morbida]KAF4126233.1 hypothetical protein GMORB2_1479 [Geosmithia morbida]